MTCELKASFDAMDGLEVVFWRQRQRHQRGANNAIRLLHEPSYLVARPSGCAENGE
jgi:hypothetical protein